MENNIETGRYLAGWLAGELTKAHREDWWGVETDMLRSAPCDPAIALATNLLVGRKNGRGVTGPLSMANSLLARLGPWRVAAVRDSDGEIGAFAAVDAGAGEADDPDLEFVGT